MSNTEQNVTLDEEKDDELEQLLDSALEDFERPPPKKSTVRGGDSAADADADAADETACCESSAEQLWNDEFLLENQKQFEQNLKTLFDEYGEMSAEQFGEHIQKLAEKTSRILTQHSDDPNFTSTIAETLRNISEDSERLQGERGDDISSLLEDLNLGIGGDANMPDMLPFMQNMMQSFLSKQVLYPCIKEIAEKYPDWLEGQKGTLAETEYDNYRKQCDMMLELCDIFEKETAEDGAEIKKARFTKILTLLENMHKLGHPPKEVIGEGSPYSFDENGMPNPLPGIDSSQCSIM